jgi:hypothetical protein
MSMEIWGPNGGSAQLDRARSAGGNLRCSTVVVPISLNGSFGLSAGGAFHWIGERYVADR